MGRADSPLSGRMLFAFGARRSGTYWLQRILGAHPDVAEVPSETMLFSHGIAPLLERFQHGVMGSPTPGRVYVERDALLDSVRDLCDTVFAGFDVPGRRYVVERSPLHVGQVGLIGEVYPDARFVHIVRDGRDAARSLAAMDWGPGSLAEAAEEWRDSVRAARLAPHPEHWVEVRYEALLADPAERIADLYRALDLDVAEEIVAGAVAEAGIPRNVDPADSRRQAGKWREHFSAADLALVEGVAGEELVAYGYPLEGDAVGRTPARRPSLRGWRSGRKERAATETLIASRKATDLVGRFLAAVHGGRPDDALALLAPDAAVRIVGPEAEEIERGAAGAALLRAALAGDAAWRGRQTRGDMHPALPTFAIVLSYELPAGGRADRVLVLEISGDHLGALALYRPPLPGAP